MAQDQVQAMAALGFERFGVAGHDRGGRVAHRMALDHPDRVRKIAVLDIVPTRTIYRATDQRIATDYYHWFFLIQPFDFPEHLIGADPDYYVTRTLQGWGSRRDVYAAEAMAEYLRCFRDPAAIHAACEDYRAAATIDLAHDRASRAAGVKIECPLLVLWGAKGKIARWYDAMAIWRQYCGGELMGGPVDSGHYLAEEAPGEVLEQVLAFFC